MGLEDELRPIFKALSNGQAAQVEALGNRLLADTPDDRRAFLLLLFARTWTNRLTSEPLPDLTPFRTKRAHRSPLRSRMPFIFFAPTF